jgi:trimethylamine--corrinoid protein Co-methyltransferase
MQAGAESLMSTLLSIIAGATFVLHGAGELENTITVSYEKILIDNEIIDMARRFVRGIEVTPETLAFDVIREIGPRGNFLATDHTVRHFRTEHFMPSLLVRDEYEVWKETGRKRAEERAADRARELLQNYQPEPLPDEAVRELETIFASAGKDSGIG